MSTVIDQKVVEMRFDNKHFERNVQNTMSTLDKLKQTLHLTGATKGLDELKTSAKNTQGTFKELEYNACQAGFSFRDVWLKTSQVFEYQVARRIVNSGKNMIKALTIDPIKTGFSEYETQINAVQTILANTESKGTTLQQVNRALDELNTYADKTIYNFTEMTKNIGTFTAAGIDLNTSVSAIQGIANLAAVSGSTSQQASTAMYQLSQALSSGTVKLMDWNSVVNAGMGGQVFQDALKETARVHGVKVDAMIKKNGSFRESLQEGWITSEILTETLEKFTMAAEEGTEEWTAYKKSLMDKGYTAKQAEEILKMANTATEAATKVKTFTQLWDTLKESAQSGWTQTWEIIVGDFGEAKDFLTNISDTIGGMLGASADARNKLLSGGLSTGWKQLMGAGIADEEGYKETLQKVAKENGFEFGKLITETEKNGGTFDDALKKALSDGSLTSDMLTTSVSKLSEKMQGMTAKQREAAGYTKEHVQQIKELDEGLKNGSISMDDFVKKMSRSSGRENLIKALTNSFNGLMNIIKPIKEAWRDIFPAMQSEQLYNITVKIEEMTARFAELTEKYGPKIKSTFKGIFSVIDIGVTIIKEVVGGIGKLLGNFTGFTGGILDVTASLGDWLSNLRDSIKMSDIFGKAVDKVVGFLQKMIDKIKEFGGPGFKNLFDILKGLFDMIGRIGISIGKFLGESLREGDIVAGIEVLNTALFSGLLLGIKNFIGDLSGAFDGIGEVLGSLKGILESYQQDLQAKTLLKIASAIGILAVSLLILASIKPEKLNVAITAMTALFGELLGALYLFGKISPNIKNVIRATTSILALSTAMLILSAAMKIMSTMDWNELGVGLTGTVVGLGALVGAVNLLPEKKISGSARAIKKLSTALVIFALAMKIMATMSWTDLAKGLTGTVVGLGALVGAVNLLPKSTALRAAGMLGLATSLVILGGALKIMATMSWTEIGRGLTVTVAGLGALVAAVKLLPKSTALKAIGMLGLATSLVILGGALKILGTMSWDEIGRGLAVMGGALTELVIAVNLMKRAIVGSAALLITANAMIILAGALKILGSMSWESIGKGMAAIAGVLVLLAAAGYILTPIVPTLLGLAGAFALVGVGTLALGAGLVLIATGITAVAIAVSTGATAIVAGLTAIILGLIGLIPEIVKTLGNAILVLCDVLVEAAPTIADTILVIVDNILRSLVKYGPSIVDSLLKFLILVLRSLRDHLPDLIVVAVEVIGAFFDGIVKALKGVDPSTLLKGVLALTLLTGLIFMLSSITSFIPGAMVGVLGLSAVIAELALVLAAIGALAQIPGLSWLIEEGGNFLQKIGTAIGQFIGGLVGGLALGATSTLPEVGTNLSNFMTNLVPFIHGVKLLDKNILGNVAALAGAITLLTGANLLNNITSFIPFSSSLAELGTDLSTFMMNALPFITTAMLIPPSALDGVKALADAILTITAANLLEGIGRLLGGSSLADFANEIQYLAAGLNNFIATMGPISPEQVETAKNAAEIIKTLASAAAEVPNTGGLLGDLVGNNDLGPWAEQLPLVGAGIVGFVNAMTEAGITDSAIGIAKTAAEVIKTLAKVAQEIPNTGGLLAKLIGDNTLDKFAENLPDVGKGIAGFADSLGTFDDKKVGTVNSAANAIRSVAELGHIDLKSTGKKLESFGDNVVKFGTKLKEFVNTIGSVGAENISSAVDNMSSLITHLCELANAKADQISSLADALKKVAKDGVEKFVQTFNSQETLKTVKDAMTKMIDTAVGTLNTEDSKNKVTQAGKDFAQGFANGITNNKYLASDAGSAIGKAALAAAKAAIDSNSPSKESMKLGNYFGEGFAIGIKDYTSKVYNVSEDVADNAKKGLSRALSKVANIINSDMDTQPTIRPVLDLSDVESGAGYLNSLFNNPSIGVMSNVRAISSGMNARLQNGANNDVVSAIDDLGKKLGNVGGTTNNYNVNGVSYNDESNVANAVQTLIRAVIMEGRI